MSKFQNYLKTFDITSTLTEEDIEKTMALLQIYGPTVRRTAARIDEFEEECYESRRQSISDFINLAIDYDRDTDRKRIRTVWRRWGTAWSCFPLWKRHWY